MFKLSEFLVKGFLQSFKERSLGEGQVMLQSASWYAKGTLNDADMAAIQAGLEEIKAQWEAERQAQENAAKNDPEEILPAEETPPEELPTVEGNNEQL